MAGSPPRSPPALQPSSPSSPIRDVIGKIRARSRSLRLLGNDQDPGRTVRKTIVDIGAIGGSVGSLQQRTQSHEVVRASVSGVLLSVGTFAAAVGGYRPGLYCGVAEDVKQGATDFTQKLGEYLVLKESHGSDTASCETDSLSPSVDDGLELGITSIPEGTPLPETNTFDFETGSETIEIGKGYTAQDKIENVLTITAFAQSGKELYMRALLDTGASPNLIRLQKARRTGFQIRKCTHDISLCCAGGQILKPLREISFTWYFANRFSNARSYDIRFLVVEDSAPYDVVLGFKFLRNARLFTWNENALILIPRGQSEEQRKAQVAAEEAQRRKNEEIVRKEKEEVKRNLEAKDSASRPQAAEERLRRRER